MHKCGGTRIDLRQVDKRKCANLSGGIIVKKLLAILLLAFILAGCGGEQTYETIGDVLAPQETPLPLEVVVRIPEEAAAMVMTGEDGAKLYMCDDYFITIQTMPAGDMNAVFRELTGYSQENLQIMQSQFLGLDRYRLAWSAAGEGADQIGRATVYSDGNYCYALTAMAPADKAADLIAGAWQDLFDSFRAVEPGSIVDSGS